MSKHTENKALQSRLERYRATLASIGDAVIASDTEGRVTFLNPVAESLTGWTLAEAAGQALDSVFRVISEESRQPVESPAVRALREGTVVRLAGHCLLIDKSGTERPAADTAAPIRNDNGSVSGAVLVFRDATEQRQQERQVQAALSYAESVIATLRHPFTVLEQHLQVQSANGAFYRTFHVSKAPCWRSPASPLAASGFAENGSLSAASSTRGDHG